MAAARNPYGDGDSARVTLRRPRLRCSPPSRPQGNARTTADQGVGQRSSDGVRGFWTAGSRCEGRRHVSGVEVGDRYEDHQDNRRTEARSGKGG